MKRSDHLVGRTLGGRYRVDAKIGEGAHGAVFRGWHLALELPVAIKVAYHSDGTLGQRFRREARTLMKLSHPHVVRVYDYAREPDGLAWLAQEFVPGQSLQQILQRDGPLDPELVVDIGLQTLSALAAAHARGIVHRDVKLSNIMLDTSGAAPAVRLLDFGVAGLGAEDDLAQLTADGGVVGTPAFMAPEQIHGAPVAASDLYALGIVLFCLLTGHKPYPQAVHKVFMAHMNDPIPPLPRAVPGALAAVVRQAMAKTLDRRYRSADEMAAALRAVAASFTRRSMRIAVPPDDGAALDPAEIPTAPPAAASAVAPVGVPLDDADLAFLRGQPIFRGLDDAELAALAGVTHLVRGAAGTVLFDAGVPSDGAYMVKAGELCAELVMPDGQARAVARFGPGVVVGEIGLVESETRSLRVRITAEATLYHIDRERFAALRRSHHPGAYKVIRNIAIMLCDRLRDTNARIREQWQGKVALAPANLSGRAEPEAPRDIFGRLRRLFGMG